MRAAPQEEAPMMFMTEVRPYAWNPMTGETKATKRAETTATQNPTINANAGATQNSPSTNVFAPRVSLIETTDAFMVRAEIPGMTADQLELSFEKDALLIKGEKARDTLPTTEGRWLHEERAFGRFERTFRFTTPVDADSIQAETSNGILTIRILKAKSAMPKKINVISKS
jgi:HSP20 family protein